MPRVSDQSYIYQMPVDIASASLSKNEIRSLMARKTDIPALIKAEKTDHKGNTQGVKSEPSLPRSNNEPRRSGDASS
jgi:hypothetical protein